MDEMMDTSARGDIELHVDEQAGSGDDGAERARPKIELYDPFNRLLKPRGSDFDFEF